MRRLSSAFSGLLFGLCVLALALVIWGHGGPGQFSGLAPALTPEKTSPEAVTPVVPDVLALVVPEALGPLPQRPRPRPDWYLIEPVDRVLVEKGARRMTVYREGKAVKTYRIALGFAPIGDKVIEGDGRTPEGVFRVNRRNPQSSFHLSLGINYPQPDDIARARAGGYSPGGDIMIHGQPNGRKLPNPIRMDWTAGCIAVSNDEIEELWRVVAHGTEVEIRP
ncbi:MAG: L,D-transpeptidase family protein [Maritimibacter sp.]